MTDTPHRDACADARRALLRHGDRAAQDHVARCASCARFRESLARVDSALASAARTSESQPLPAALRAQILSAGAALPARSAEPRGRLIDFALRLGAVAAVLAAIAVALPTSLSAAELDSDVIGRWTGRIGQALRAPGPSFVDPARFAPTLFPADVPPVEHAGALGVVALTLLVAGVGLMRRERVR